MAAYVIFDVEGADPEGYQEFMLAVEPALEGAGARYLAQGGAHRVHEGDWAPRRLAILELPSVAGWEAFYNGDLYQGLEALRDENSPAPVALARMAFEAIREWGPRRNGCCGDARLLEPTPLPSLRCQLSLSPSCPTRSP